LWTVASFVMVAWTARIVSALNIAQIATIVPIPVFFITAEIAKTALAQSIWSEKNMYS
jgi:hypothetical protein